jgi:hypothetical protein
MNPEPTTLLDLVLDFEAEPQPSVLAAALAEARRLAEDEVAAHLLLGEVLHAVHSEHDPGAKIEDFFEDLGLAPWPGEWVLYTKVEFVLSILEKHTLMELADVARRVSDEINAPELLALVDRLGPTGVTGDLKNLIFAADGPKPKIILRDAINNDIVIVENEQHCLVYDRPLGPIGLTWKELTAWWADREGMTSAPATEISRSLYRRLARSLGDNDAERRILRTYGDRYVQLGPDIPALIPQVYLHYDPYTKRQGAAALTVSGWTSYCYCPIGRG